MSDYNLTLFEACEYLNRSKKSLSRYIRRGLLHPQEIKSQQGTLEYRFSKDDLEAFKAQETQDKTRQETGDTPDKTSQSGQTEATPSKEAKTKEIIEETRPDKPEQTSQDKTQETGQDSEIINLLKETTGLLKEQLVKKDEQIKDLGNKIDEMIQRDRETNILPDITMEFQGKGQVLIAGILLGDIQGDGDGGRVFCPPRRRVALHRRERPLTYSDAYVGFR